MKGIIYKITCICNNKSYIGQTTKTLNIRKSQHLHAALYQNNLNIIYKALRKYGKDKFKWEILEDEIISKEKLNEKEEYYIKLYNTHFQEGYGYNMTFGGQKSTQQLIIKLFEDPEFRKRHALAVSKNTKKTWKNPETRKKRCEGISKARFEQYKNDRGYYNKISNHLKKQAVKNWENPETRKKLIEERSNVWKLISPEGTINIIMGGVPLREFCKKYNLNTGSIYNYVKLGKVYKGWKVSIDKKSNRY